jgi:hypothetical protein
MSELSTKKPNKSLHTNMNPARGAHIGEFKRYIAKGT